MEPAAAVTALVRQLDTSQWATPAEIASSQLRHLGPLVEHLNAESPSFASRLRRAGLKPVDLTDRVGFGELPVLTRRDMQGCESDLYSRRVPPGHGEVWTTRTSGSMGEPVAVRRTGVSALFWGAMAMRQLGWHGVDPTGRLCSIRANVPLYAKHDSWGAPASSFGRTGPMLTLPIRADVAQLTEWISEFRPHVLVIYPSTLDAFTAHCERHGVRSTELRHILTIGETLHPAIRAAAGRWFDTATVCDCYSSQEVGYIALECPASGLYHAMAEGLIAEVLNEAGEPCRVGEVGRATITDLHNYATPLIRYDIGDLVEMAPPCACGRGLPTWKRIVGRERNLVLMPDGTRHWPVTGFLRCREVAPVVQYQFVQQDRDNIEARLVVERALSATEEEGLRSLFTAAIGYPFAVRLSYFDRQIPRSRSGKYEEFVCDVPESLRKGPFGERLRNVETP